MQEVAERFDPVSGIPYFGPARVLEHDKCEGCVRVLLDRASSGSDACKPWARLAIVYPYQPQWGDTLLVAGKEPDQFYVIGVLSTQASRSESRKELALQNGARTVVSGSPGAERIGVFSGQGGLIFEYDAETGKSRVDIPEGDLEIMTRKGDIAFTSAKGIRLHGEKPIEMESPGGIGLAASNDAGINLKPNGVSLGGPAVGIRAQRGDIQIEAAKYTGKRFSGTITSVNIIAERLETLAETVIQKAKNLYRTVERLTQIRTGRLRTLVDETYQLKSKNTFVKTEKDFKVRADQIYLG